jgi:hypothetical protein
MQPVQTGTEADTTPLPQKAPRRKFDRSGGHITVLIELEARAMANMYHDMQKQLVHKRLFSH